MNKIKVNECQKGNILLRSIHNVPWEFSKTIACDYQIGKDAILLFLSMKYHRLHPNYISNRISEQLSSKVKVLLCLADVQDHLDLLLEITTIALRFGYTLMIAWSWEEAAKIVESYKAMEFKPSDSLKPKAETDSLAREFLKSTKILNKTDISNLIGKFGSLKNIITASVEELLSCSGMGQTKCNKLVALFNSPLWKKEE